MNISIIIPIYNTCRYLPNCIESVLNQSFSDFELLLVDDGSTDGSDMVCDEYAEKDGRIQVFHKENGGVSSARNLGLDYARGEWVLFIDSDDLLPSNALGLLMTKVDRDVDMVYGAIRKFDEVNETLETIAVDLEKKLSVEEALDAFIVPKQRHGDWQRYLFNRIYRLSIIKEFGVRFITDIHYKEDGLFVVQYLCRCDNRVVCIPDIVYLYRQVPSSAMGSLATAYNPKLLSNIDSHGYIYRELKKRGSNRVVLNRELNHLFQNYYWISGIMRQAGVFTKENKRLLVKHIIKNTGFIETFYRLVIIRYALKIKRKLLCISR